MTVKFEAPGFHGSTVMDAFKWVDGQHKKFSMNCLRVHRKSVFQILTYLLRICPVDTGRLRGSWTPFFDRHGNASYQKWMKESGLAAYPVKGKKKGYSEEQVDAGKAEGEVVDQAMRTVIGTNVAYAEYAEEKVGFLARATMWGQDRYRQNFESFLQASQVAGQIPEMNENEEAQ